MMSLTSWALCCKSSRLICTAGITCTAASGGSASGMRIAVASGPGFGGAAMRTCGQAGPGRGRWPAEFGEQPQGLPGGEVGQVGAADRDGDRAERGRIGVGQVERLVDRLELGLEVL